MIKRKRSKDKHEPIIPKTHKKSIELKTIFEMVTFLPIMGVFYMFFLSLKN